MDSYLTAEVSASAVQHNAALLRRRVGPGVKLCAVVKADCYGHGLVALLGVLSGLADCLAVATGEEAIQLRRLGYERPILMFFSPCAIVEAGARREMLAELIAAHVTLTVVSAEEIEPIAEAARHVGSQAEVHVKIDTGMNRSGVPAAAAGDLLAAIRRHSEIRLAGLYTHFATADEPDKTHTLAQLQRFLAAVEASGGRRGLTLHAANSAATIDLPATHLDMIRPGIALYGCQPSVSLANRLPLRPALRLWAPLMQKKLAPAGARCGYGLTYTFATDTPIGLVPVGYADGYLRCLSNRATMRLRGRDVPVRGRVSMDQVIVDLSAVPDARIGEEVEILSNDPAAPQSVENIAAQAGTIPYEITCLLGGRARRVLVD